MVSRLGNSVDYLTKSFVTEHEPKMWDDLRAQFMNHLDEVKANVEAANLPKPRFASTF